LAILNSIEFIKYYLTIIYWNHYIRINFLNLYFLFFFLFIFILYFVIVIIIKVFYNNILNNLNIKKVQEVHYNLLFKSCKNNRKNNRT